ncbi:cyclic nucleotide-binding domain-containing protein [Cellvibrio sp. PSBB023]|uniref:cyclic nucleotide-binding domain-containing protein n=1 Tax=Cellvibrio sp. PSBB023 TaxID=1945512 RepID=UPI001FEF8D06|nr:cyclic nucleotide-binding domain-containing protein [Cellvibrio sp. PSBB023]
MMETKPIHKFPKATLEQLLSGISFFKAVRQQDPKQFDLLVQASRVVSYQPGEVVVQKGELSNWLYFLLKGKLAVYVDQPQQSDLVNYVTPGEVFGDLAQLVGQPRTATIIADQSAKESTVLALDINVFGPLNAISPVSRETKLIYYRNMAHNLRWKLEVYRSQHLQHELANKHRQIKLYHGPKDSFEELQSLFDQSKALAILLIEWNKEFGALSSEALQQHN